MVHSVYVALSFRNHGINNNKENNDCRLELGYAKLERDFVDSMRSSRAIEIPGRVLDILVLWSRHHDQMFNPHSDISRAMKQHNIMEVIAVQSQTLCSSVLSITCHGFVKCRGTFPTYRPEITPN